MSLPTALTILHATRSTRFERSVTVLATYRALASPMKFEAPANHSILERQKEDCQAFTGYQNLAQSVPFDTEPQ